MRQEKGKPYRITPCEMNVKNISRKIDKKGTSQDEKIQRLIEHK